MVEKSHMQDGSGRHDLPCRFAVFSAKNGKPDVVARFENDDVWLTQKHLAIIFNTSKQLVSHHIKNILESGELEANRTVKKLLTVQSEGGRDIGRLVDHYNLDMVIALGYRIDSPVAIRFRQWATERLHELIQKGFSLEDERLKQGGNRYFKELLQRIRDIRSSERSDLSAKAQSRTTRQSPRQRKSSKSTAPVKCASSSPTSTKPSAGICEMKIVKMGR